ncbi:OLC1v1024686C1 [Oldenlandia corymbosa var. corymbosa]|uniref:OLC1v1024686C1 n=1 Tax=Oldenlandia corymbosa var. corymbosa TaxID=529605 RepID=A0AAV1C2Y3_OLDCO|nr:OLC1v1024686C1 [Oldenlandia corymbosa var. corymbosa]
MEFKYWEFGKSMIKPVLSFSFLLIPIGLSSFQKLGIEAEIIVTVIRSFIQLLILGFVLQFIIFNNHTNSTTSNYLIMALSYTIMVSVAGYTSGRRARGIPRSVYIAGASILAGTSSTMLFLVLIKVLPFTPRYMIPCMGMMVAGSMRVTGVTMKNLREEMKMQTNLVETALALGATRRQAAAAQVRRSVVLAVSRRLDFIKTMGVVVIPGAVTGILLAGGSPFEAIQLQLVVVSFTLGATTLSSVISTYLCMPFLFTKAYQLQTKVFSSEY